MVALSHGFANTKTEYNKVVRFDFKVFFVYYSRHTPKTLHRQAAKHAYWKLIFKALVAVDFAQLQSDDDPIVPA